MCEGGLEGGMNMPLLHSDMSRHRSDIDHAISDCSAGTR